MAKVLEGPGMGLLRKWGMAVPNYAVITSVEQLDPLAEANAWLREGKLVVKAHEAIGSRFKLGLVKVDIKFPEAKKAGQEMLGKTVEGLAISQVIVSEMVAHKEEYYVAVKSDREGTEILLASIGGIEIEGHWEKVQHLFVELGEKPKEEDLSKLAKEAGFKENLIPKVVAFVSKLFVCYENEDGIYLEINPLVLSADGESLIALDAVTMLDGDARFRHPDWDFSFASEFGRPYSNDERDVMEIDSRIKGSVKFIQIPGGDTALLPAGGGASVFYADAVVAMGGKLANYAEYSGDPADWAVEVLTDKVCSLPGIKRIIVGGAIANFTNVKKTFGGIINGFRRAKSRGKLEDVEIWVRRGGPQEKEGLAAMKALEDEGFKINVYDRTTPLTDIVNYSIKGGGAS